MIPLEETGQKDALVPLGFWGKEGHQQKTQDDDIILDDQK